MKGEDKKWLLIEGCFICSNPDDQTMQSYLVERGAKVLMAFQGTLFSSLYNLYHLNFVILYLESVHLMAAPTLWLDLKKKWITAQAIVQIKKHTATVRKDFLKHIEI